MVLHVVAVGRVRAPGFRAASDDYAGRVRRYFKLEIHEVRPAGRRAATPEAVRALESERVCAAVPGDARLVALTRRGTPWSSATLAAQLRAWQEAARDVAFLIGGAFGLDEQLVRRSEERVSLGPLTLPHELARVVLLEQLYRAGTILRGEPYHKDACR